MGVWSQSPKWLRWLVVALAAATLVLIVVLLVTRSTSSHAEEHAAAVGERQTAAAQAEELRVRREAELAATRLRLAEQEKQRAAAAEAAERKCQETRTAFFSDIQKLREAKVAALAEFDDGLAGLNRGGRRRTYNSTADIERDCDKEAKALLEMITPLRPTWKRIAAESNRLYQVALRPGDGCALAGSPEQSAALQEFTTLRDDIEKSSQGIALYASFSGYRVKKLTVRGMRLRYGDLRRLLCNHVGMVAAVQPAEYYNCKYRSQSRWRSFELGDADGGDVYAYCRRGETFCDRLFETSIDAPSVGVAVLRYPESNQVCEEQQAELVAWNPELAAIATVRDWQPDPDE